MRMIFNELEYAEKLLKHGFSKFMSLQDLTILAKYYRYNGKSNVDIQEKLITFCQTYNPDFNEIIHYKYIQIAIKNSEKYDLRKPSMVSITQKEIKRIQGLKNYKLEKILFILIVLAKFYKNNKITKNSENKIEDNNYYVNAKFTEILRYAKVNVSKEERYYIMHLFYQLGLWSATYIGSYKIKCIDRKGEEILSVDIEKDLVEQYIKYKKENGLINAVFIKCIDCGREFEIKSNNQNRCEDCRKTRRTEQNRKKSIKYWNKLKS